MEIQELIIDYLKNPLNVVFVFLALCFLIQIFYYFVIYIRLAAFKNKKPSGKKEPVSVIICARNESENLRKNLPKILEQDYPDYEVIVVNDCSSDESEEVLQILCKKYKNLRYTNIVEDRKFSHGKKLALTIGIKAAKNEILLLTDADCLPVSKNWIRTMQSSFTAKHDIVLGYGGYFKKKGLLNNYIRYDTLFIGMQYLSYALFGTPYMGTGRNMAYKKSFFFNNKGFASHSHILSGDDDLFINEVSTKKNTLINSSHEGHTRSESQPTINAWFKQKRRHLTTWRYYKRKHKFMLGLEVFSRLFFYLSFIILASVQYQLIIICSMFGFRLLSQLIIFKIIMNKLKERDLLLISPVYDFFSLFINFVLNISSFYIAKRNKWN